MRSLDDLTVVSLEQAIATPYCARQLADRGARVIKIERPGVGDFARAYDGRARGLSSHVVWTACDKKAYELLIQSEVGLLSVTGAPEEPAKAGISIADIAAGVTAVTGILDALLLARAHRPRLACRGVDAREHGRVNGLSAALRARECPVFCEQQCTAQYEPRRTARGCLPDDAEARMDPVPAPGEHSDAILVELEYGADEVASLRASGAV